MTDCQDPKRNCADCDCETPEPVMPRCDVVLPDGTFTNATVVVEDGCITDVQSGEPMVYQPDPCCNPTGGAPNPAPGPGDDCDCEDGEAATITIGNVQSVGPGQPAQVVNVGNNTHAILDFYLPRGGQGDPGVPGSDGGGDGGVQLIVSDTPAITVTPPDEDGIVHIDLNLDTGDLQDQINDLQDQIDECCGGGGEGDQYVPTKVVNSRPGSGCIAWLELTYIAASNLVLVTGGSNQTIENDGPGSGNVSVGLYSGATLIASRPAIDVGSSLYSLLGVPIPGVSLAQWNSLDGVTAGPCYIAP